MEPRILAASPLFAGVDPEDIGKMLSCLSIHQRTYEREAYICTAEEPPRELGVAAPCTAGVVIRGSVNLIKEDYWGNRAIITKIGAGGIFGEACSCIDVPSMPVSVVAAERSEILFLNYRKVTTTCPNACPFHAALIQNMLGLIARKNSCPTFPSRRPRAAAAALPSLTTARSWPTTSVWTAAPCLRSWANCARRVCWNSTKTSLPYCKRCKKIFQFV